MKTLYSNDRPPPALSDLESAHKAWMQSKKEAESAKEQIHQALITLGIQVYDKPELRNMIIRELYWNNFDISVPQLSDAFGLNRNDIRLSAGAFQSEIPCDECNEPMIFTSRDRYRNVITKNRYAITSCPPCIEKRRKKDDEEWEEHHAEANKHEARIEMLRKMPYHEYLSTPEWRSRREIHLKKAGYRCQLCNGNEIELNVHHRTYERRGNEYFRDLIVLCANCHAKFHDKLPVPPKGGDE